MFLAPVTARGESGELVTTPVVPFLRWAGSKRWLMPTLLELLPREWGDYYEPFLGSASTFFAIAPEGKSFLSDALAPLVNCFQAVRDHPERVARHASTWSTDKETYYQVRGAELADSIESAAQFIYLNKLCFNGLYRENQSGKFNVPYGRPKSDRILFEGQLEAAASTLSNATIDHMDFEESLERCCPGDLVYLDPPYVAGHRSNGFVDYNAKIFSWEDQGRLARIFKRLNELGVHVVMSNADHSSVRELYSGYQMLQLERYSSMSGKSGRRGPSAELVVLSDSIRG